MAKPNEHSAKAETAQPERASPEAGDEQTEEWVFTLNSATGEIVKVEKIDKISSQRQELSNEEYAALSGYLDPSSAYYAAYGYDPYASAGGDYQGYYEAGYHQGLIDYETTLMATGYDTGLASAYGSGYSPEETAAYLQGIADYEAMLG